MKPTQALHDLGQSLWVDNITRDMLDSGTLKKYIDEFSATGLTSNPTIFDNAISKSDSYDPEIERLKKAGYSGEALFFELALQDLSGAADLFLPIHWTTATVDGMVSLEVSPLLAYDTEATIAEAKRLFERAHKPNLFIKIPGTKEGLPAIEEAIFSGVNVNVTLLFSSEHCKAAADAYMRGLERRVRAGLDPDVRSVASIFISRWDKAVMDKVSDDLRDNLGIAVAHEAYCDYRAGLHSDRWQRLQSFGARPQRLLFASTSTKDPRASDTLYIGGLAAPNTVNTMPDKTMEAFADHGKLNGALSPDGGNCKEVFAAYEKVGISVSGLAAQLQKDGADSFVKSWQNLLQSIETKSKALG